MNLMQVVLGSTMTMRQNVFCPENVLDLLEDLDRFRGRGGGSAEIWPSSSLLLLSDKTIGFVVDDPLDILLVVREQALWVQYLDNGQCDVLLYASSMLFEEMV